MFQSYDQLSSKAFGPERLAALRAQMESRGIDVWLLPHGDEHQNEYMPDCNLRLEWLTGFSGSAGFAVITTKRAILFVDGRYTLQAAQQVDENAFEIESLVDCPPWTWLESNLGEDEKCIALDPWCITIAQKKKFEQAAAANEAKLLNSENLVDAVWQDRPGQPVGEVSIHEIEFAGKLALDKINQIKKDFSSKAQITVLTDPSSICWLFNIRGSDVAHNPVVLAWAILHHENRPILFIDERKLSIHVKAYLTQLADLEAPENLSARLEEMAPNQKIMADPTLAACALVDCVSKAGGEVIEGADPVKLPRAIKNETELAGCRKAHVQDGVAMARFLHWLDTTPVGELDEIIAAKALENFRKTTAEQFGNSLKEVAFDTISGFGANGAIVHYRVNEQSNSKFSDNSLYLVDSGGQYDEGTTDITRTVSIATPPQQAIEDFTLVLKGHIAIATCRFPEETRGVDIDAFARHALWQQGKDYGHGTGHGVGAYLAVHEGPQSISKRGMHKIIPGMIVSNEPGFYRENEYGIRIENLVIVGEPRTLEGGNVPIMEFETVTLCPIDKRLIDPALLSQNEIDWLNTYHNQVLQKLSPHLNNDEKKWLAQATAPMKKPTASI